MPNRDKILLTIVGLITAAILLSNVDGVLAKDAQAQFDRNFTVSGPVQLAVDNSSGSVHVTRGNSGSVVIHADIRTNHWLFGEGGSEGDVKEIAANPPVKQEGNTIRVMKPENYRHVSINYEIQVPEQTVVESATGSGSQSVEMVKGPVTVSTGSGSVKVREIQSQIEASSGSGSIEINDIQGPAQVKTGSGSITAEGIAGAFKGETGSGHLELRVTAPGDVYATTGSGHLELNGVDGKLYAHSGSGHIEVSGKPSRDWELHAGSGGVDVHMANGVGFDVDAHAGSGTVNVSGPITMESSASDHHEVRGKVRGGGPNVEVTTGSGSISID
jgi:DUF4097 and DUF4098 domain-containing protein YvlB